MRVDKANIGNPIKQAKRQGSQPGEACNPLEDAYGKSHE
jgi:hypothetical protein